MWKNADNQEVHNWKLLYRCKSAHYCIFLWFIAAVCNKTFMGIFRKIVRIFVDVLAHNKAGNVEILNFHSSIASSSGSFGVSGSG